MDTTSFLANLDQVIADRAMLSHSFYQAWSEGRLDKDVLGQYARQYFAQVKAFPTYVSAVHSGAESLELRRELLENLIEEERGDDNHPELWLRFAEGLGVNRDEVLAAELLEETKSSVSTLRELTRGETVEGLAALYAYESQIPEVAQTKRAGLKEFYGIDDDRSVSFFTVHEKADVLHRKVERDALGSLCDTDEKKELALAAAAKGADALLTFLDGVERAYLPSCA
jgi:pyrroloquinoline-quinone synthase